MTAGFANANHGDADGSVACTGVVIEDKVIDRSSVGRDWAPVHRWVIAFDDGRLLFANDEDLAARGRTPVPCVLKF
ncbi:hypothetical protein [Rhodococcus erythropolis]|uniref:hypothetical protein n=1 Tax=Rhodococcus erythropolis TaxID=1833 RepID=UPI00055B4783|nr:hypothetical protein [Rhodococcus erythropolis]